MIFFSSIRAYMGSWVYYIVRMSMRDAADNIKFASEVWEDRTLDDAIQRELDESRAKEEIVEYLAGQGDRFFAAIVVAALEGNPTWFPLDIAATPEMKLISGDSPVSDTFGLLRFDGQQKYYVLDGQHRLFAIKELLKSKGGDLPKAPDGFGEEHISVIFVVPDQGEAQDAFLERYRRLFGNLNRYARPTGMVTNIIMDEDDVFAILTRRLVTDHKLFKATKVGDNDVFRVKTTKGENLRDKDSFFTSLVTLYKINMDLLLSRARKNGEGGWPELGKRAELKRFVRFRPNDEIIGELYAELVGIWDKLQRVFPELTCDPPSMRKHDSEGENSALFRPIGQKIMARLARRILNIGMNGHDVDMLGKLNWQMHDVPWRNLLLVYDVHRARWKMRSESRKDAIDMVTDLLWFQMGFVPVEGGAETLRRSWEGLVLPGPGVDERDDLDHMWEAILANRL